MEQLKISRPLYIVSNVIKQSIIFILLFFFFCSLLLCRLLFAINHHVDYKIEVNLAIEHTVDQTTNLPNANVKFLGLVPRRC